MHIIWENLSAMLVVMGISLLMVTLNVRNQEMLTETTAYTLVKKQGLAFSEVLKRDLQGVVEIETRRERAGDSSFVFTARLGQDTTLRRIVYRRYRQPGMLSVHRVDAQGGRTEEQVPYYQVERFVDGKRSGGSAAALVDWEIQALNENQQPLEDSAALADCRMIYVRFEMGSPVTLSDTVDRLRWETTFVPPQRSRSDVL